METMYGALKRLWRPGEEALGAISDVLSQHWRAAARMRPHELFSSAVPWLRSSPEPAAVPVPVPVHQAASGGRLMRYASGSASVAKPNLVPRS
jgi:hypothetical protein